MNETIGKILADARAKSGMSVEEVARITRINAKFIRLLEENRFDQLPGLVFIKGLLRTYSAVLGLSGDEMVEKFDSLGVELTDQSPRLISMPLNPNKKLGKKIASTFAAVAILGGIIYYYAKPVHEERSAVIDDSFRRKVVEPAKNAPQLDPAASDTAIAPQQNQATANSPAPVAAPIAAPAAVPVKAEVAKTPSPVESQSKKPAETKPAATVQPVAAAVAPTPAPQPQKKPAEPAKQPVQTQAAAVAPAPATQPQKKPAEPAKQPVQAQAAAATPVAAQPAQKTAVSAAKPAETVTPKKQPQEEKPAKNDKKEGEKSGGKLTVTASEESWVGVVIDGSDQRQVILQPGQSASFHAGKRFRLTVGNVKATKAYLNGEEIKFKNVLQNVMKDMELPVGQKRASQTGAQQDTAAH